VLVIGKFLEIFWIEPVKSFRIIVGKIEYCLYNYGNFYTNPGTGAESDLHRISNEMRNTASDLKGNSSTLPKWKWVRALFGIPNESDLNQAASCLVGISNRVFCPDKKFIFNYIDLNEKARDECRTLLKIE